MALSELESILHDARSGNAARDVSGALIYADGIFLQILEGEREEIEQLLQHIEADPRHTAMKVFHAEDVGERVFRDWHMACVTPDRAQVAHWLELEGAQSIEDIVATLHDDEASVPRILVHIVEAIEQRAG